MTNEPRRGTPDLNDFLRTLERVVDRLRTLGESRLTRTTGASGDSIAQATLGVVRAWAVLVHGEGGPVPPALAPLASGDQLAVLGTEVGAAWRSGALSVDVQRQLADQLDHLRRLV